jgi:hypothetical protein
MYMSHLTIIEVAVPEDEFVNINHCRPNAAKFPLGKMVITANAHHRLDPTDVTEGLRRHASADWGDLPPEDAELNEIGLKEGGRLFSAYGTGEKRFWIITEWDRSVTTVLMPEDY